MRNVRTILARRNTHSCTIDDDRAVENVLVFKILITFYPF